jgi:hypothetical protein
MMLLFLVILLLPLLSLKGTNTLWHLADAQRQPQALAVPQPSTLNPGLSHSHSVLTIMGAQSPCPPK